MGLTGKGLAGKGTGQIFLPEGYPGYSLLLREDEGFFVGGGLLPQMAIHMNFGVHKVDAAHQLLSPKMQYPDLDRKILLVA